MIGLRSMTGYASVAGEGFTLSVKSVNHRFLDLQIRLPPGCDALETRLRATVRNHVRRGHVELTLQAEQASAECALRCNDELLGVWIAAFRDAADRYGLFGEPDLNVLLRIPGVMVTDGYAGRVDLDPAVVEAAAEVLMIQLNESRAVEGAALATGLHAAMDRVLALTGQMAVLRAGVRDAHVGRLRARLMELLDGIDVGPERLLAEAAMLAERSDVEEELVRMKTHALRFQTLVDAGGELGKTLDFLLQEMNREANTMVSKVNGAMGERGLQLTDISLAIKADLEKTKEQVQNLE